jgi:hypothetical protein
MERFEGALRRFLRPTGVDQRVMLRSTQSREVPSST